MRLSILLLCSCVLASAANADEPLKILTLGDSITAGGGGGGGYYRHRLHELLSNSQQKFQFVGPKTDKRGLQHGGYPGWNSDQVRAITEEVCAEHPADIVLLHMAHNHYAENKPVEKIVANTRAVIQTIVKHNPKATIFLAQSITAGKLPKYSYIPELNKRLASLATELADQQQISVVLVDQATGFDWKRHTVKDKVHPNDLGARKMAQVWATAMSAAGFKVSLEGSRPDQAQRRSGTAATVVSKTTMPERRRFAPGSGLHDSTKETHPDIIWILAEDISNELSCYGEPGVQTPHIDALAEAGTRYERAYCTGPACSISRSAMMSGIYQTRIDAHDHRRVGSYTFPAITQYLRAAGYYSAKGCGYSGKTDLNFKPAEKLFDSSDWSKANDGQPVFAQITLPATHRQDVAEKKWNAIRAKSDDPVDPAKVRLPPYYPDVPEVRRDWAVYLDQMEYVDGQVGAIIERLKKEDRYDKAMIIFCGDNGRCHLRGKNWLYEPGLKVPLIIKWPKGKRAGEVVEGMVSMMDVTATVVELAKAKPTEKLDGRSLVNGATRDLIFAARDAGGEIKDHLRSACNGRWKYIRNYVPEIGYIESKYTREHRPMRPVMLKLQEEGKLTPIQQLLLAKTKPAEELYDLQNDPHEINNLAAATAHAEVKKQLAAALDRWIESTGDTGLKESSGDAKSRQ